MANFSSDKTRGRPAITLYSRAFLVGRWTRLIFRRNFSLRSLAHQFGVTKKRHRADTWATLAMRPFGALLFGLLAIDMAGAYR